MSRTTPTLRDFAKFLVAYETNGKRNSAPNQPASFHACEKLRAHLITLMGIGGYRSLLARALALAGRDVPWLRTMVVTANGTVEESEELHPHLADGELFEGRVALLTQLLGLLVIFVGQELTVRLAREVWPDIPVGRLDFANGTKK